MSNKPKILVTGSNGQLGMELQVLAPLYKEYEFVFLSKEKLPLQNPDLARDTFLKQQPQFLINCGAYTAVDKAETEKDLAFQVNGEAVGTLAALCKEYQCRFIHISTDYVFDGTATSPYKEDALTNPQSVYGASKLKGEKLAMQSNEESIIIRTSWVYSSFGKNFVKTMLKLMSERSELNVVNDQLGSPTYAADLAEVILQIIRQLTIHDSHNRERSVAARFTTSSGIFHFSNSGNISWFDFALAIRELSGSKCNVHPIPTSAYPTPAKRPAYSVLDKTKIQETFGVGLNDWKESLVRCIQLLDDSR